MGKQQIPSVLAFEKKLVPSDGLMYGTTWEDRESNEGKVLPLKLIEKSVRGTVSHRSKSNNDNDILKLNAAIEQANLHTVDSCFLGIAQDTLKLHFTLKILSGVENPCACNKQDFYKKYQKVVEKYIENYKFEKLAFRYATNIANARFLWRNRVGAEKLEVQVKILNEGMEEQVYKFDALSIKMNDFEENDKIKQLADKIAKTLSGSEELKCLMLDITVFAKVGRAQDVYPSEELVLDQQSNKQSNNKKKKILYHIDGQAAIHSQKLGNALRTIDTWYPDFSEVNTGPIAIEPYGSVVSLGVAYRRPGGGGDFYTFFDKYVSEENLEREEDKHFVMGVLIRGGVFGKKDEKEKVGKKSKKK